MLLFSIHSIHSSNSNVRSIVNRKVDELHMEIIAFWLIRSVLSSSNGSQKYQITSYEQFFTQKQKFELSAMPPAIYCPPSNGRNLEQIIGKSKGSKEIFFFVCQIFCCL